MGSKAELKRREKQKKAAKSGGFESMGLSSNVFRGVRRKGYRVPTPIHRKAMPLILAGGDVAAMARTGSGKTAAFLFPCSRSSSSTCLREALGLSFYLRISLLVGGDSMESQFEELAQNPDIIIATPGRLMHHLSEVDDVSLRTMEYVVFDEADCLFSLGFAEQLHEILTQLVCGILILFDLIFIYFISKPIRAAPTEEEVLQDMDGVMSKIDQAIANGETVYGRFPQTVLDLVSDRVREIIDSSVELTSLQKACTNAFRLYSKTKPLPARESIRRAKDLPREGLHPIFINVLGGNELSALAFSERLKAFRPKQTILEAEGEAAKSKHLQGPGQWVDVMKKKIAIHEEIINLVHQQRSKDHVTKVGRRPLNELCYGLCYMDLVDEDWVRVCIQNIRPS
ncbi:putative DEAD-box ATP-dependent RNA helicase 29 [Actinidia rufa]|uniref:Putative DEAD-box ATP-dependent RNA helicase 29 n=1 Tax=Actinidia rufa TaxID=165716 RepID=A0A7J0DB45_9ERIC|nr:putative DEAD-box ATP-dependent RNA helicase 29 [Actinidia rufa]